MHLGTFHNRQTEGIFVLVHGAALGVAALGLAAFYSSSETSGIHTLGVACLFAAAAAFVAWRAGLRWE